MKNRSKSIAIIHYSAPRKVVGGVELVIEHHAKLLSYRGYEVHMIYGEGGELGDKLVVEHRIPLLAANNQEVLSIQEEIGEHKKPTLKFYKIKDQIKEELVEILSSDMTCIVHNIPSMPFNFAATAAINELTEELKNKFVFWLHDSILFRDQYQEDIDRFPFTLLHHRNPRITYTSPTKFRAEQFSNLPTPYSLPKINVIPNGVDVDDYIKIDEVTKLLMNKLGLSFDEYIILTPVRVTPRKNIEFVLKVTDELIRLIPDRSVKLLVTGPPDHQAKKLGRKYMDFLQGLVEERSLENNVIFCYDLISHEREYQDGEISKWSVADVYNISDIVFIPSKEEGFGLPVIEAGAARRPIFCSRIPPFQELIREDIEGYMFSLEEEPRNIAFRIFRQFLTDRVESNFNNVTSRFSWDAIIDRQLIPIIHN